MICDVLLLADRLTEFLGIFDWFIITGPVDQFLRLFPGFFGAYLFGCVVVCFQFFVVWLLLFKV